MATLIEDVQSHMTDNAMPDEVNGYLVEMLTNARRCAVQNDISDSSDKRDQLHFWFQNENERFICKKSDEWKTSPLGFVIFWGRERPDVDLEMSQKIWAMDAGLIETFVTFQQVLIYYSMKSSVGDKNWINLVVLSDPYGPFGWTEHPLHAKAVAYSPKYYEVVHLYRGVLNYGLNDEELNEQSEKCKQPKFVLLKKTYIDYRAEDSIKRFYFKFHENGSNS